MSARRASVIVCAHDAEDTIEETLRSLFAQTSAGFDIVVIDDGSTDATPRIVDRLSSESPVPLQLVRTGHEGLAGARNHGIASASGEFFSFVDADDTIAPEMVEHLLACADSTGADLVVCEMQYVDFETGAALHVSHEGDSRLYGGSLVERPGLLALIGGSVCNKLISRSLFEASGITFPAGAFFEDLWVAYRLCGEAHRIGKVDEPLYRYRIGRQSSIVNRYDDRYLDIADALAVTNDYFRAKGDFEKLREDLQVLNYFHLIYGRYTNLLEWGPRDVRHRYLARAFAHMDRYFPGWRHASAIREMSGRWVKYAVFTHRVLLSLFSDMRASEKKRAR